MSETPESIYARHLADANGVEYDDAIAAGESNRDIINELSGMREDSVKEESPIQVSKSQQSGTHERDPATAAVFGALAGAPFSGIGIANSFKNGVSNVFKNSKIPQTSEPPRFSFDSTNPIYEGHELHPGSIANAEFNAHQRLANELRTNPTLNSSVDSLLRDRSAMAPVNAEQMRREIQEAKPFLTKVAENPAVRKAGNIATNTGKAVMPAVNKFAPVLGLASAAAQEADMENRWTRGDLRNRIQAVISGLGATGSAGAAIPFQPPMFRAIEGGIGMGAPLLNTGLDWALGKDEKKPVHKADGGPVLSYPMGGGLNYTMPGFAGGGSSDDAKKFQLSTGAIEDLLGGYIAPSQFPAAAKHDLTHFPKTDKKSVNDMAKEMAMNYGPMGVGHLAGMGLGTIKNVGGNWFPPTQAHVENTLGRVSQNPDVSKWLSTTGRKYILNRMGSPEDEVKKLYDQGISHSTPEQLAERTADHFQPGDSLDIEQLARKRKLQGFPESGNAYENAIDASIQPREASHWQQGNTSVPMPDWVKNLDPKSKIYNESNYAQIPRAAGMDTLARTIEKDLASGKLRPEQLNKVSIEDAVRRSHQQRLESQSAAEKASQSIPKVREYPSGYSWNDLTHEDPATLDAILKKEGDIMQNCIGGYCSDVLEDGTKLYSLRDPAGNPHVNVEVKPKSVVFSDIVKLVGEEKANALLDNHSAKEIVDMYPELRNYNIRQVRGKQNEVPTEDYLPYARDFAMNPVAGNPYSDIWGAGDLGLHDVNKIKQHGLVEGSMGPYYGALDRLFPTEVDTMGGRVLAGQHGVKIPTTEMLRLSTEDLPGRYVTQDQILEHLNAQEPRPIEQGYSKYYKGTE